MNCCKECKWYFYNKNIKDAKGTHECYGHYLVCSPVLLVDSVENKNECPSFERCDQQMTEDEIRIEWMNRITFVNDDKYNAVIKSLADRLMAHYIGDELHE